PGQTIFVADGQYAAFEIKNVRGTKERPITIKALGKGTTIAAESAKLAAIQITHSRHIVIDGIASRGNKGKAIFVRNSHGVTVRNSVLAENGRNGIEFSHCNDALIENNDIYDNQKSGISFSNSGDRVTIRGNRIRNNTSGVMMGADLAAGGADEVAPDGVISDVLIENNVISDCGSTGAAINLDGIQKAIIRNNVLSNNGASGIALYNASGASGPIDVLIAHNTVDMAATSRPALLLSNLSGAVKVRNNILMARNTARATVFVDSEASSRLIDADRNVFVENLNFKVGDDSEMIDFEAWQALGHDKNSLLASPDELFIEPGRDYHLKAAAPARGRGEILNPAFPDAEGQPRPADTAPDIGAYQRR
ncbi:MAG TPA: right-handed parallel beta-helix repeat-containing protein, partial [Planctomycetota bacterium]|nr:right-handed parallel beta-helix repeat-containing protein [Planctomycetota bacterium]